MPVVDVNPEVDVMKMQHLVEKPVKRSLAGVDYDLVSKEDLEDYAEAMEALNRGEYLIWDPNAETLEAFVERTREYV